MKAEAVGSTSERLRVASVLLLLTSAVALHAQTSQPAVSQTSRSVPGGTATDGVRHLTLNDAIDQALRYNLGAIESGENARAAGARRLQALSALLPQISLGVSYNRAQVTSASLGLETLPTAIPPVIGPFGFATVTVGGSQIVNVELIRRLRAAESAERAA